MQWNESANFSVALLN